MIYSNSVTDYCIVYRGWTLDFIIIDMITLPLSSEVRFGLIPSLAKSDLKWDKFPIQKILNFSLLIRKGDHSLSDNETQVLR